MFAPQPNGQPLTPIAEVLGMALNHYARHALLFIGTATLGAFVGNLFGLLLTPTSTIPAILWGLVAGSVIITAQVPMVYIVIHTLSGEPVSGARALSAVAVYGPRFFTVGFIIGLVTFLLALSGVGLVVAFYIVVRVSLFSPVVILENRNLVDALKRSWLLVQNRWWRTFAIQALMGAFAFLLLLAALSIGARTDSLPVCTRRRFARIRPGCTVAHDGGVSAVQGVHRHRRGVPYAASARASIIKREAPVS